MRARVNILASVVCVLFSVGVQAQSPYSYYYQGQKINLTVNKSYLNLIADGGFLQSSQAVSLFELLQLERETPLPSASAVSTILKFKFQQELSSSAYDSIVAVLQQHPQIKKVLPFFETGNEDPIGTSDIYYVKLKNVADTLLLRTTAAQHNVEIIKQVPYMPLWFILSFKNSAFNNSLEATNYFYESGLFADIDPAFMFNFQPLCANDPQFSKQWGMHSEYGINICDAWAITRGAGISVTVVDQGIDFSHPDLAANIHPLSFDAKNGTSPSVYDTANLHGLHVAGIIAAVKDNNLQVVGVAPDAKIMGVSHPVAATSTASIELASGIAWAWRNGADIINNSWGVQYNSSNYDSLQSAVLEDAIIEAMDSGRNGLGTIVIFAAGNAGEIIYPGGFHEDILVVGANDIYGNRAAIPMGFQSGTGYQLDIVCPGRNILSTVTNHETDYSSGTSMAAPHCAGIAALMLSVNPNLTRQEVCNVIERTARKITSNRYRYATVPNRPNGIWNDNMGYGLANAFSSVLLAARNVKDSSLLIRDTPDDVGLEPNNSSDTIIYSPDIWIRLSNDGSKSHQEPCNGDTVYINVRVWNAGWYATHGGELLHVYVKRTDSATLWDEQWQGNSYPLHTLTPGKDTILVIPYIFPNAPSFSILAFVDTTVFTLPPVPITDLVRNSRKIAMRNLIVTEMLDLMIADAEDDLGDEPFFNSNTPQWESPSIWVRNQPDRIDSLQSAIPDTINYIYLKIKNIGSLASSQNDSVKIYWAKSGTNLMWDSCWNGNQFSNGSLMGDCIGAYPIPILPKGEECIMEIPWHNTPDPSDYLGIVNDPWGFHLLARIISDNDPMTFTETTDIIKNIENCNNIAGRSIEVFGTVNLIIRDDENPHYVNFFLYLCKSY